MANTDHPIPYWYEWNFWEPSVQLPLMDFCKPGDIVYDVGANAGALTLLMSRAVGPKGAVFAFEASRRIVDKTQHNMNVNGCGNVQLFNLAVSAESGNMLKLYQGNNFNDSAYRDETGVSFEVETISLDDFAAKWGHPSVVKMDIEGGEYEAVKGFSVTIRKHRPALILEQSADQQEATALLLSLGYRATDLATYDEVTRIRTLSNVIFTDAPYVETKELIADSLIPLCAGRYVIEVVMSAEGRDNEMMAGLETDAGPLFRYHTNTAFLASSYRFWPVQWHRETTLRAFFNFQRETSDPTFKVDGFRVYRIEINEQCHQGLIQRSGVRRMMLG